MHQYCSCLTHMISSRIKSIPIFLSRVCSSNETFSVRLNLLLGKLLSPSTSLSPFVSGPPVPILNRSSKSPKSIKTCSRSSSSSLNIVPRTWEQEISHILYDSIDDRVICKRWTGMIRKEAGLSEALNRYRGMCKSTITLRQVGKRPGQVSNWAPPGWKLHHFHYSNLLHSALLNAAILSDKFMVHRRRKN